MAGDDGSFDSKLTSALPLPMYRQSRFSERIAFAVHLDTQPLPPTFRAPNSRRSVKYCARRSGSAGKGSGLLVGAAMPTTVRSRST